MKRPTIYTVDPKLDLVLERTTDVPRELVWEAWTKPEHLKKWFTPHPWKTVECEIDLRPGGIFRTVMQSPEGEKFPETGCYLEVIPGERLTWTNAFGPGFRPRDAQSSALAECDRFPFTAVITFEAHGKGTKYTAHVLHADEAGKKRHEELGFQAGWAAAWDQLVHLLKK